MAERVGFEPTVRFKTDNALAGRPIRPLWHLSWEGLKCTCAHPPATLAARFVWVAILFVKSGFRMISACFVTSKVFQSALLAVPQTQGDQIHEENVEACSSCSYSITSRRSMRRKRFIIRHNRRTSGSNRRKSRCCLPRYCRR